MDDRSRQPFNPLLAFLAALAAPFFLFPLIGLVTGAPWGNMFSVITSKSSLDALQLSLIASLSSTVLAVLFGFPLAWLLARGRFRGKAVLRGLTTLPMVLPPVVGGIALLLAYGRRGIIGEPLNSATATNSPSFPPAEHTGCRRHVSLMSTTSSPGTRSKWRTFAVATRQPAAMAVAATMRSCAPTSVPAEASAAHRRA